MTQAKAQTVASAVIGAGHQANVYIRPLDNEWVVIARSPNGFTVNPQAIANLATAQGVIATVAEAEFS